MIGVSPMVPVQLSLVCTDCRVALEPRGQVPHMSTSSMLSLQGSSVPEMHVMHMCPSCKKQATTPAAYPLVTLIPHDEYERLNGEEKIDSAAEESKEEEG